MIKTVVLNSAVSEIEISGKQNAVIRNLGNNVAYVSATPNISVGSDVIIAVKPGKMVTLEGVASFKNRNGKYGVYGTIYAFSSDVTTIEIIAANKAKNGGNIFMYNDIAIEKALYNLAGKNLTQALEQIDPSSQYAGTDLASLDAYERQLKRFDIRTDIDTIDKFFGTKETAVLFPEFVRRAIKQGFDDTALSDITAADTRIHTRNYRPLTFSDNSILYSTTTNEGATLNKTNIAENISKEVTLVKTGRLITTTYEVLMRQSISEYALALKTIGFHLANGMISKAVSALYSSAESINIEGSTIAYSDITNLYGKFSEFNMDAILVSPSVAAQIITMSPMESCTFDAKKRPVTPFGTTVIKCLPSSNYIIGLDTRYALEAVTTSEIMVEINKNIEKQLEQISISVNLGFYPLNPDAVKKLVISTT